MPASKNSVNYKKYPCCACSLRQCMFKVSSGCGTMTIVCFFLINWLKCMINSFFIYSHTWIVLIIYNLLNGLILPNSHYVTICCLANKKSLIFYPTYVIPNTYCAARRKGFNTESNGDVMRSFNINKMLWSGWPPSCKFHITQFHTKNNNSICRIVFSVFISTVLIVWS